MHYIFEWDPRKAAANLRKHGVSFEGAAQVFLDPLSLSLYDRQHSRGEDRWITLGKNGSNRLLVVVHTFRQMAKNDSRIRVISARRATRREARQYSLR
ncbi:MAG: BrnT family toxin [Candidatus Eisenbacteria bacterium]